MRRRFSVKEATEPEGIMTNLDIAMKHGKQEPHLGGPDREPMR